MLVMIPFRSIYVLRMIISLCVAGGCGAFLNSYGLRFWLVKHA